MLPYFLSFLDKTAVFSSMLFIPLLAKELGANLFEVGIVPFSFGAGAFISYYLFGRLSDLKGERKLFIVTGALLSSILYYLHIFTHTLSYLIFIRFITGFTMGIYSFSLILLVALKRKPGRSISIINAFSSLGIFTGWIMAGVFREYNRIFIFSSLCFFLFSLLSLKIREVKLSRIPVPFFPWRIIKRNWRIYFSFSLRHIGATSIWTIFPIYLKKLGGDKFTISLIYALNPMVQFLALLWITRKVDKLKASNMISLGLFLSSLTFTIYAFMPDYHWAFLGAVILGLSWATLYTGSLLYLTSQNLEKGTATGILGSAWSTTLMIGPFLGGSISYLFSMRTTIFFAACLPLIGLGLLRLGKSRVQR